MLTRGALLAISCLAAMSCSVRPAECTYLCRRAGTCPFGLTCGGDGYCHTDGVLDHCVAPPVDAGGDGGAGELVSGGPFNYVFVTSTTYMPGADFTSLATADERCRERATAAGLSGVYRAWLSTATMDAKSRLVTTSGAQARGWIRTDGRPFADSVASLADGVIYYPPRLDELRNDVAGPDLAAVATGTSAFGTRTMKTAQSWTSPTAEFSHGSAAATTYGWTEGYIAPGGSTPVRLYCFGVDHASPLQINKADGRRAFVSTKTFAPNLGVGAADQICADEAGVAGFTGQYLALLNTIGSAAASRFDAGSNWVRVDGVPWLAKSADLATTKGLTSLNVDASGAYRSDHYVWTGGEPGVRALDAEANCSDWSATNGMGVSGSAYFSNSSGFNKSRVPCGIGPLVIYCLQAAP